MTAKSSAFYVFGYFLWEGYGCMFSIKSVLPQRHGERRENLLNFRNKKNTPWKKKSTGCWVNFIYRKVQTLISSSHLQA